LSESQYEKSREYVLTNAQQACGAIRNLSVNAENKVKIVQEGGLPPLIALLRSPLETIQEQAAVAIRNISVNPEYDVKIVQVRGRQ